MSFKSRTKALAASIILVCATVAFGYDPPKGAIYLPSIFAPWALGGGATVTGEASPWASSMNPSVLAGSQLTQVEAGYTGISDFVSGGQGWGSAASIAFALPMPYGVWGGEARFFSVPASMTSMPLGTFGGLRASFSKAILPDLYVGSAVELTMGGNAGFGWGLGADLGATWFVGDMGFLKNSRLGFSLQDIGKGYGTIPLTGIFSTAATSYPSAFTLGVGLRGYLLQSYDWKIDAALDLKTPSFQDLDANLSFGFAFREYAKLSLGWDIGLRDVISASGRSLLPSVGIGGTIPLGKGFTLGSTKYRDATVRVQLGMTPLYDALFATGAGVGLSFGLKDRTAPVIEAKLPVPQGGVVYISPNSDGIQDSLTIPMKISDDRYIAGWSVTIEDKSSGKVIRIFGESNDRLESIRSLDNLKDAVKFTLVDVNMPTEIVWDGKDNFGRTVADGAYTLGIIAWDDNGNTNPDLQSCMTIVVNNKLPQAIVKALDDKTIFSPDGDGSKDDLKFRNTGSVENQWKIEIKDASGKVVRNQVAEERSGPKNFTWDGTANDGKRVPDGVYSLSLSARNEGGSLVSTSIENLVVDTRRPSVAISTDESVMSPNADGVRDSLNIQTAVESFDGLESWKVFVLDPDRKEVWSLEGGGDSSPEKAYVFGGRSTKGEVLADGQYEAGIELRFANGYSPQKLSSPFYMDKTPPSASITLADANRIFSPDADGNRDSYAFDISSTEEDGWNLIIRDSGRNEKVVRRFSQQLPSRFEWNGRDDQGRTVQDGEYEVYVFAVDRAGNSFSLSSSKVRIDTRKPKALLTADSNAFSPNGDGIAETIKISIISDSYEGLSGWKFSIADAAGKIRFEESGLDGSIPAREYVFSGKNPSETNFPEGIYTAKLDLAYIHGFVTTTESPALLLDRTYPQAKVELDKTIFNPSGNALQSKVRIVQSGSDEKEWLASVVDSKGAPVRTWRFEGQLQNLDWNGKGDNGLVVADGLYRYRVASADPAGNAFASRDIPVEVDTLRKEANLAADTLAFSPNGDGVKDRLGFRLDATASSRLAGWTLEVLGSGQEMANGSAVKSWKGESRLPSSVEWNGLQDSGLPAPDGSYVARLSLKYPNGDTVSTILERIVLDRLAPAAKVSLSATLFSPNGDGTLDEVRFDQTGVPGDSWLGTIFTANGEIVKRWNWQGIVEGFVWDGNDESGSLVGDGLYHYELTSSDSSGNKFSSGKIAVGVETAKKAVRLSLDQRAFSPNGDGTRDSLALGATVQLPERIKNYELVIVAQEGSSAMNAIRSWKGSGSIPARFVWAGETDAGIPAPDGRYAASLTVLYTNGDTVDASTPVFVMDRVFPKIETSLSQEIFSPNGDGRSDSVEFRQASVAGDDWSGKILASDGSVVKSLSWKSEAKSFIWDGRDDTGGLVRDGSYRYVAESLDVAGNRTVSAQLAVTVETEKKTVRVDADTLAFSPNGDGVKDLVNFGIAAQSRDRIRSWNLDVFPMNAASTSLPVKTWGGSGAIADRYSWDGTTDSGLAAPDGRYMTRLTILYINDDRFEREAGPVLLDRIAPQATVRTSATVFSPNGDGRTDSVQVQQESLPGDDWQGVMIAAGNKIVRTWMWKNLAESFVWDGKDGSGIALPDGSYEYEIRSVDAADNSFISPRLRLEIDASKKLVRFEADQKAFSPNGDGIKDRLFLNIQAPRTQAIREFEAAIFSVNASGVRNQNAVRTWRGTTGLLDQYPWDGTTDSGISAPDGSYQAILKVLYDNDDLFTLPSGIVLLDTQSPKISLSAEPLLFSPNGDGNRDEIRFRQSSSTGDDWTGRIRNAAGTVIRTWTWKNEAKDFSWDGKDSTGTVVRDGIYSYEVVAIDQAGNSASARIANIQVDAVKPKVYVTSSDSGMSPNGDGIRDEVSFTIVVERREGIESWRFSLTDRQGVEKSFFGGSGSEVPARLVWDGRDLQGQVVQGEYTGKLLVRYAKGDIAQAASSPVLVDVDPPKVDIIVNPEYFSPDGDGSADVLTFDIAVDASADITDWKLEIFETAIVESSSPGAVGSERLFIEWSGKGKPLQRISWDGKSSRGELVESATDYPFKFIARDKLGNTTTVSGFIAVDVLVIRDGDRLKIKVPSIVFRANYADFAGLSAEIVARNEKVVARVAQILEKFPDYRIRIEGHANNIGKMLGYTSTRIQAEETRELIPLSTGRAELVRTMLIQNGLDARRLSVQGLGSSEPVVSFNDVENRWKNRRVEFVLIKNQ